MNSVLKKPSGWVPVVLSFGILLMELGFVLFGSQEPEADEGAGAHLFQIWLVLEFFFVAFFAAAWLPREPKPAMRVLIVQIISIAAGMFPVFYFQW